MTARFAVAVSALIFGSGCWAVVHGDGVAREETRGVGEFRSIDIGHDLTAEATLGSPAQVTIEGDGNLLPYVETRVLNGRLEIGAPGGVWLIPSVPLKITVVSPTLVEAIASGGASLTAVASPTPVFVAETSGGASLTLSDVSSDRLVADGSGLSTMSISGQVTEATLAFSGGASVNTRELGAENVRLDGSGGSRGTVRASNEVTGEASGGSHFSIVGRPQRVDVDTSGGSSIQLAE